MNRLFPTSILNYAIKIIVSVVRTSQRYAAPCVSYTEWSKKTSHRVSKSIFNILSLADSVVNNVTIKSDTTPNRSSRPVCPTVTLRTLSQVM